LIARSINADDQVSSTGNIGIVTVTFAGIQTLAIAFTITSAATERFALAAALSIYKKFWIAHMNNGFSRKRTGLSLVTEAQG
jgi:hypothetical protein